MKWNISIEKSSSAIQFGHCHIKIHNNGLLLTIMNSLILIHFLLAAPPPRTTHMSTLNYIYVI